MRRRRLLGFWPSFSWMFWCLRISRAIVVRCSGPIPQQPPMMVAPRSTHPRAYPAKSIGRKSSRIGTKPCSPLRLQSVGTGAKQFGIAPIGLLVNLASCGKACSIVSGTQQLNKKADTLRSCSMLKASRTVSPLRRRLDRSSRSVQETQTGLSNFRAAFAAAYASFPDDIVSHKITSTCFANIPARCSYIFSIASTSPTRSALYDSVNGGRLPMTRTPGTPDSSRASTARRQANSVSSSSLWATPPLAKNCGVQA
mmetsp:Transcript_21515/g.52345  ORF Transcript_21515/g.52345 Transcript_21515/m.52345 type:complete len:255 (+) Transcript_21515:597-1361(+)